jgi:hypothetical protein
VTKSDVPIQAAINRVLCTEVIESLSPPFDRQVYATNPPTEQAVPAGFDDVVRFAANAGRAAGSLISVSKIPAVFEWIGPATMTPARIVRRGL